jgi:transposase
LREIRRKDSKERYHEYVKRLAEAAGEPASTAEEVARFDRKRKDKKCSNKEWEHPHDPDARIGRDKHGATDMLYKLEKTDDLDTGAIVSVTVQTADTGDTDSIVETLVFAEESLSVVRADERVAEAERIADKKLVADKIEDIVGDKGYHSSDTCSLRRMGFRTYFSEPERGERNWQGQEEGRYFVYGNRRRIRGVRGKRLRKLRGEHCERNFAHLCDTGGQRRTFLRGLENVGKKALIGAMGFNMGLLLRKVFGIRKPRQLGGRKGGLMAVFASVFPLRGHGCRVYIDFGSHLFVFDCFFGFRDWSRKWCTDSPMAA